MLEWLVGCGQSLHEDKTKARWIYIGGLNKNKEGHVNTAEDFDPVYTSRSYNQVQNAVRRKVEGPHLTERDFAKKRADVQKIIERSRYISDQDQIDFHKESAICKGIHKQEIEIDYEKAHRLEVQKRRQRLLSNPNKVREDLWRGNEKDDIDRLKQELIFRKVDLQTKQWMERKEHNDVK